MADDIEVTVRRDMMRLIDDQQVERRHCAQVAFTAQRLHHGEHALPAPGFAVGVHHRGADAGIDAAELAFVLLRQLVAVRQHAGFAWIACRQFAGNHG